MGGRGGGSPRGNSGDSTVQAPVASVSLQDKVVDVIRGLRSSQDDWVSLASFRDRLGGSREEQDSALMQLARNGTIRLIPEENRKTIDARDKAASINVSGEPKHLIGVTADF